MGTAGGEHGDDKPQMIRGLMLGAQGRCQSLPWDSAGQWGPQGLLVGCIVGLRGSRRLWLGTRVAAYQPRAGLQSDFGNPDELSII